MSQVTAGKTNINRQVNEIYISFMKAVIVMRRRTMRRLELPDELDVASWSVLASDESANTILCQACAHDCFPMWSLQHG